MSDRVPWRQRAGSKRQSIEHIVAWRKARPDLHASQAGREWRERYPEKVAAQRAFSLAVKSGSLVRKDHCERCGHRWSKIHAHHDDYTQPLAVIFLCMTCHAERHRELRRARRGEALPPLHPEEPPLLFNSRQEWQDWRWRDYQTDFVYDWVA